MGMSIEAEMPILWQLMKHAKRDKQSLHVPGHHQGRLVPQAFAQWLGRAFLLDATELPGLDDLHDAEACIAESQNLARLHYQSEACLYSVNGSTACIMAAITACLRDPKQKIAILNPPHISAWRGLVLADAMPVFGRTNWMETEMTCAAPTRETLDEICAAHGDIAAVYLTSPTYQGHIAEVSEIVKSAHHRGLPVIVDEAHGAHLGLIPQFAPHSVAAGADVVIQSTHKTLPSLTQTAWVHWQGERVSLDALKAKMSFFQSTSPSYLLLASLDAAQAWLRLEGPAAAERFLEARQSVLGAASRDGILRDDLRHWLPLGSAEASQSLAQLLRENGMYLEYADLFGTLAMFSLGDGQKELRRYQEATLAWQTKWGRESTKSEADNANWFRRMDALWQSRGLRMGEMSPKTVESMPKTHVLLKHATNRVVARPLVPYPPGVALVWPGERLSVRDIQDLQMWQKTGLSLQGVNREQEIEVVVE
jgi:arginine decarboxylase